MSKLLICLSVLVALFGAAQASKHLKLHPWKLGHKQELLQTKATAETVATTTAEATTESEAECDPACVYKFPYLESKCSIPQPPVKPGEIFVTDFEDCFTFDLTVPPTLPPKEPQETFVLDYETCYNFRATPPPDGPPKPPLDDHPTPEPEPKPTKTPEPEKNETCETKVTVYRYPFIDPDAGCEVEKPETGTIEVVNPDKSVTPGTVVVVDEDGRIIESKVDEYGEYYPLPPDVPQEPLVTYDEEDEITLGPDDERGEAKEEFVILYDVCYTYEKDADTGETIYENHEDVTTGGNEEDIIWQTDEPNVVIDEEKEVILIPPETPPPEYNPPPKNNTNPPPPTNDTTPPTNDTTPPGPPKNDTPPVPPKNDTPPVPPKNDTIPPGDGCPYDNYTTGTTIIYGQPVTYITKNTYDVHQHHSVSYTYVLTNVYSGIFKTEEYNYVIYGAGAVNFYNNYYHIDARIHDTPSCSCTCGYQTYTFTYSFGF